MENHKIKLTRDKLGFVKKIVIDEKELHGVKEIVANNQYKGSETIKEVTVVFVDAELTENFVDWFRNNRRSNIHKSIYG